MSSISMRLEAEGDVGSQTMKVDDTGVAAVFDTSKLNDVISG